MRTRGEYLSIPNFSTQWWQAHLRDLRYSTHSVAPALKAFPLRNLAVKSNKVGVGKVGLPPLLGSTGVSALNA
jgi:hypothetical protein